MSNYFDLLLLLLLLFFFCIIIIIKNECHSIIIVDRLQGCICLLVLFIYSLTTEMQTALGLYPLPHPDGLTTEEAFQLLRSPTNNVAILPQIPKGTKRNVYCLIDNSENQKRRTCGLHSVFDDDCGPWQSSKSSCVTSPYVIDHQNGLKRIFWVASQLAYCSELKIDGKRIYSPLDPQPSPDTVIKIRRYYVTLAVNDDYRRRITTLVEPSVTPDHTVAIVEYFDHNFESSIRYVGHITMNCVIISTWSSVMCSS